jgi:LmbE family N-acetylglucosaminyl deacetylase
MKQMMRRLAVRALRQFLPAGARSSLRLWMLFDLPDRASKPITDFSGGPVVVLAPHMDDEIIGPGGTVALHVQAGASVSVLLLTDGSLGDPDIGAGALTPEEIARRRRALTELRKQESRCAAQIAGVSDLEFYDAPDGALTDSADLVEKIAAALQRRRPTVIYAPALTDFHVDHWAANRILRGALDRLPQPLLRSMIIRGYEIWSALPANRTADITSVIKLKEQAIGAFASQTKSTDFVSAVLGLNRYRSMQDARGRGFAEAFLETTVPEYREMFDAICLRNDAAKRIERQQAAS